MYPVIPAFQSSKLFRHVILTSYPPGYKKTPLNYTCSVFIGVIRRILLDQNKFCYSQERVLLISHMHCWLPSSVQQISRNVHTVMVRCVLLRFNIGRFNLYSSGLLNQYRGNPIIAPVPVKQPWGMWENESRNSSKNNYTTTKQNTTKPRHNVSWDILYLINGYVRLISIHKHYAWTVVTYTDHAADALHMRCEDALTQNRQ